MNPNLRQIISLVLVLKIRQIWTIDTTSQPFVSAFGEELTDVFVRSDGRILEILLASDQEPLLRRLPNTKFVCNKLSITSIVPGNFDGDAFMDLLITAKPTATDINSNLLDVYINWGSSDVLNCTDESAGPLFQIIGEPVALDYNRDMIIDLFGMHENGSRVFWIFNETRQLPEEVLMVLPADKNLSQSLVTHSHAYLDLNNDYKADLFLTTENGFEIWLGAEDKGFTFFEHRLPIANSIYGQSIFLDIELNGNIVQVLPVCTSKSCRGSMVLAYIDGKYFNLLINFKEHIKKMWQFIPPDSSQKSSNLNPITLKSVDFNLDGYPDLLVTLQSMETGIIQTFLVENVECNQPHCKLTRSFFIRWKTFAPYYNGTIVGAFHDNYQDGIFDVIFIKQQANGISRPVAFRNTLDYDDNFVKVMVLTGITNKYTPPKKTPLGDKKRTYESNLPGLRISYSTTQTDGDLQANTSARKPQSGYFALQLSYAGLGSGRTVNFVDSPWVDLSDYRTWTFIIPNSQMVVVPIPISNSSPWKAQRGKLIWISVISLGATCTVITLIILALHIKKRRQDGLEKLLEN